jgi:uncharacterized protein
MTFYNKVRSITKVLNHAEKDVNNFSAKASVTCVSGCFECCTKNIFATELEFYPLAYHLYKTNQADAVLDKYYTSNQKASPCVLFNPGIHNNLYGCSQYQYRGLVCRLFGFSFNTNKTGDHKFATCKPLKLKYNDRLNEIPKTKVLLPEMKNYYARLYDIDFYLADTIIPMNEAIVKAIEKVQFYYQIRARK